MVEIQGGSRRGGNTKGETTGWKFMGRVSERASDGYKGEQKGGGAPCKMEGVLVRGGVTIGVAAGAHFVGLVSVEFVGRHTAESFVAAFSGR